VKRNLLAIATIAGALVAGGSYANAEVIYSQPFYTDNSTDRPASDFGWTALVDTVSGGVVDYVHTVTTTAAGISDSTGSTNDPGNVNATTVVAGPTNLGYVFYAPRVDANVSAGAHALFSTAEVPDVSVTEVTSIAFEQRNDNTDSVMRAAIKVGSQWYASATDFGGQNGGYTSKSLAPANFATAANWNLLTVTTGAAGEITVGGAAGSDLAGTITDVGLYIDAGINPDPNGDHARFDNFVVSKLSITEDEDFEGESGLPAGWKLVDNTTGTPVFSIVTGHDGSGGSSGSAGHIGGTYDPGANNTPGGWFQSPVARDGASPFTLTYDVKVEQEGTADDSTVLFGDIDNDDYYVLYVTEVDANNDLFRVTNGVRGGPIEDGYASGVLDDTWYRATVTWTPTSGTTGTLSVDVVDPSTSTSVGGFTQTGLVMDDTVQFGFGSFNDQASYDNISVIPEPSTFALAASGLLGLLACGRRRRR